MHPLTWPSQLRSRRCTAGHLSKLHCVVSVTLLPAASDLGQLSFAQLG